jgi:hypothetical protein
VETLEGVYDMLHCPCDNVQVVGENVPVELEDQETVPLGEFPFTVTVHSELVAATNGPAHETDVEAVTGTRSTAMSTQPSFVDG